MPMVLDIDCSAVGLSFVLEKCKTFACCGAASGGWAALLQERAGEDQD